MNNQHFKASRGDFPKTFISRRLVELLEIAARLGAKIAAAAIHM